MITQMVLHVLDLLVEDRTMNTTATATKLAYHLKPEECSTPTSNLSQKAILEILNTRCNNSLRNLKQAHALVLKTGHFQDHFVAGTLIKCYLSSGFADFDLVMKVFDSVHKPNVFVWNVVLKGCLEFDKPCVVITLYYKMVVGDSRPNKFTYSTLFSACAKARAVEEGAQIHAHCVKFGFCFDGHAKSSGIQMYASFGRLAEARRMLDRGGSDDAVCQNAMIDGYMKSGDVDEARDMFDSMSERNVGTWNALITGYARNGMFDDARKLFDEMSERDEISWSAMIDGYVEGGYYKEALEIFDRMHRQKIKPRKFVLSSVLAACANVGALDQGRWIHAYVKRNSIKLDPVLGTAFTDMYAKCGRIDLAWEVFETMKEKEVFSWNAMIGGLAMHGCANEAIELFFKMQRGKLRPNAITLVNVLNACAHGGLVDKAMKILSLMNKVYGVEPQVEHYCCMVDALGRAGRLEEAQELIRSMPMEPNAAVYGALLGACRIHGNAELGEKIGQTLLGLEPLNSGRYALLSNIYAKAGKWEKVSDLRKLMKERGIKTNPGISLLDVQGRVREFKMGDFSHPRAKEIHLTLERMIERIKLEGYSPDKSQVLSDIGEEEKETALKYHSEKIAIGFGLINTEPGSTLRIVKNLRMCEDCHRATKLVSRVYEREIIVRDRVRYHHFKNGSCSCKDFW